MPVHLRDERVSFVCVLRSVRPASVVWVGESGSDAGVCCLRMKGAIGGFLPHDDYLRSALRLGRQMIRTKGMDGV